MEHTDFQPRKERQQLSRSPGRVPAPRRALRLVGSNLVACVVVLIAAEAALALRVPRDGRHRGVLYTWGIPVEEEQAFRVGGSRPDPRRPGVPRVVVVGDSLTWGSGVRLEERYTEVAERLALRRGRPLDVVNLGRAHGDMARHALVVERFAVPLDPDAIVVGFCVNDTQPRNQDHSPEREAVRRSAAFAGLRTVRFYLPRLAHRLEMALWSGLERSGRVPTWWQALDRTYDPSSEEWRGFVDSLERIRALTGDRRLVFFSLNQGIRGGAPTDYAHPDRVLEDYLFRWYAAAEAAAAAAGFEVIDVAGELRRRRAFDMSVNPHDAHPSPALHAIYGRRLADHLAAPGPGR